MAEFNPNEAVAVVDYDPAWPDLFEREAAAVCDALGDALIELEHIGSTSVPGLPAKPTIDLLAAVEAFAPLETYAAQLAPLGYRYQPHENAGERLFFWKGTPRTYHLHIVEYATWEHQRHILFRDYLRAHPQVAAQYAALKRDLAARFEHNRPAYTEGKSAFIFAIVERALSETGTPHAARQPDQP